MGIEQVFLVIDAGNTRIKAAEFEAGKKTRTIIGNEEDIIEFISNNKYAGILIAATRGIELNWLQSIERHSEFCIYLNHTTPLPFANAYKTPETLGRDRIAGIAAGIALFPNTPLFVIDAGTCITYDIFQPEIGYVGGVISPGLQMRFQAMSDYTFSLPFLQEPQDWNWFGTSTQTCLESGVMQALIYEINGFSDQFLQENINGKLIFTGGNTESFVKHLKNPTFALPDLTQEGLYAILEFNMTQI